jgi:hypothetical protein
MKGYFLQQKVRVSFGKFDMVMIVLGEEQDLPQEFENGVWMDYFYGSLAERAYDSF